MEILYYFSYYLISSNQPIWIQNVLGRVCCGLYHNAHNIRKIKSTFLLQRQSVLVSVELSWFFSLFFSSSFPSFIFIFIVFDLIILCIHPKTERSVHSNSHHHKPWINTYFISISSSILIILKISIIIMLRAKIMCWVCIYNIFK